MTLLNGQCMFRASIDFKGHSICQLYPEKRHKRYTSRTEELKETKTKKQLPRLSIKKQKLRQNPGTKALFQNCFRKQSGK